MNEKVLNEARLLIASFIRDRRNELNITQIDLAEKCGVSVNTIRNMEAGKFWPGLKQLLIICNALDLFFFLEAKEGETNLAKQMRERWGKISKN